MCGVVLLPLLHLPTQILLFGFLSASLLLVQQLAFSEKLFLSAAAVEDKELTALQQKECTDLERGGLNAPFFIIFM